MTNSTKQPDATTGIDTQLRTLNEVITRLIVPIPEKLIETKTDKSRADFVPITTMKDLLDWACGHGRWRTTIERVDCPGNHLGMIVRLWIQTSDEGWVYQDGTGHEVTDNPKIYGDPWTNAYAQAVRRAAESFGMARELWRREIIRAQARAKQIVTASDIPKAPSEEEGDPATERRDDAGGNGAQPQASRATSSKPPQASTGAHTLSVKDLKNLQKAGGPVVPASLLGELETLWPQKRTEEFVGFVEKHLGVPPQRLTKQTAKTMLDALRAK